MKVDFSPESWTRVIAMTIAGTVMCILVTLYVDASSMALLPVADRIRALTIDVALPAALAIPLLLFFNAKLRELALANRKLTIYASTDGLTQVLNRPAFSTLVDAYLTDVRTKAEARGALLIIDADNFKSVNDSYGHDCGDAALVAIARTIKSVLRAPDIVGRLGGEEFGVFLPGANPDHAGTVAERIRKTIAETEFAPSGTPHALSVSVGGAIFEGALPFAMLFRAADQQLYAAKRAGRNRVALTTADAANALAAA